VLPDFVPVNKRFWLMAEIDPNLSYAFWECQAAIRPILATHTTLLYCSEGRQATCLSPLVLEAFPTHG